MIGDTISVIVSVHNTRMYLSKCVNSIINQTYKHLEIILVDDGSTDGCGDMCDEYARRDSRVKVIHQKAQGAAVARAAGMRDATAPFIHFVDDDDWMDANMEEEMMRAQAETGADVVVSRHYVERGASRQGGSGRCAPGIYERAKMERDIFPNMMCYNNTNQRGVHPNLWMKLFKAEVVRDAILRVDPRILKANDVAACYEALFAANKMVITTGRYYHYRLGRPRSITTSKVNHYYESMIALLDHLLSSPMAKVPAIARQFPRLVRSCVAYGMQGGNGRGNADSTLRNQLMNRLNALDRAPVRSTASPSVNRQRQRAPIPRGRRYDAGKSAQQTTSADNQDARIVQGVDLLNTAKETRETIAATLDASTPSGDSATPRENPSPFPPAERQYTLRPESATDDEASITDKPAIDKPITARDAYAEAKTAREAALAKRQNTRYSRINRLRSAANVSVNP